MEIKELERQYYEKRMEFDRVSQEIKDLEDQIKTTIGKESYGGDLISVQYIPEITYKSLDQKLVIELVGKEKFESCKVERKRKEYYKFSLIDTK